MVGYWPTMALTGELILLDSLLQERNFNPFKNG
jgi:hypothetical protein